MAKRSKDIGTILVYIVVTVGVVFLITKLVKTAPSETFTGPSSSPCAPQSSDSGAFATYDPNSQKIEAQVTTMIPQGCNAGESPTIYVSLLPSQSGVNQIPLANVTVNPSAPSSYTYQVVANGYAGSSGLSPGQTYNMSLVVGWSSPSGTLWGAGVPVTVQT